MDRKVFKIEAKAVSLDDSTFEGFSAGIGNVDTDDDQIMPGAFDKTIGERVGAGKVKFLNGHDPADTKNVWGIVKQAEERDYTMPGRRRKKDDPPRGLWSLTQVSRNDPDAQTALRKISEGILEALSIGYKPIASKVKFVWKDPKYGEAREQADDAQRQIGRDGGISMEWEWMMGRAVRQMFEVAWWEHSLVTWGANEAALIVPGTVKSLLRSVSRARSEWSPDELKRAALALDSILREGKHTPEVLRCALEAGGASAGDALATAAATVDALDDQERDDFEALRERFVERVKDTCPDRFRRAVASAVGLKAAADPPADPPASPPADPAAVPPAPAEPAKPLSAAGEGSSLTDEPQVAPESAEAQPARSPGDAPPDDAAAQEAEQKMLADALLALQVQAISLET